MKDKQRKVKLISWPDKKNPTALHSVKTGRNELCRCKSGKKAKNCCGTETQYYTLKPKTDGNNNQHSTDRG